MTTTSMIPFGNLFAPTTCAPRGDATTRLHPRTDILESDTAFEIRMDLPGVARDDLQVELDGETLTVSAARKIDLPEGMRALRRERAGDVTFRRSFELGRGIDRDAVEAGLVDGVLTLSLPKNEQAVARKVEVK